MPATVPVIAQRRARFGSRLRELRAQAGLTQEQLAHESGLDRSFYVEVENGKHSLLLDRLFDIAAALHVPVHELLLAPSDDHG